MSARLDGLKIAHEIAQSRGGKCLSNEYVNSHKLMSWECGDGHRWEAQLTNIKNTQSWCKTCSSKNAGKKIMLDGLDIAQRIAKDRGGKCLSDVYIGYKTPMKWECGLGHKWSVTLNSVKNGNSWCKICHYKCISKSYALKNGLDIAQQIAASKNGKCLSTEYINNSTKLEWQCERGHVFSSHLNSVKDGERWCNECAIIKRADLNRLDGIKIGQEIAALKNGKLLSDKYIDNSTKMLWECENGHKFMSRLNDVKDAGRWCAKCVGSNKEKVILCILNNIFGHSSVKFRFKSFDWLRTKNGKQELDFYVPHIKLAIEYDGQQHFRPVRFGGISEDKAMWHFNKTKIMDKLKNKKIKEHPEDVKYFLRFNYKDKINEKFIIDKLKAMGLI